MKVLFFKGLSVAIMVVSIAWGLVQRDESRSTWPALSFAFGLGLGIGAF